MKALSGTFNQVKALVGAFSVFVSKGSLRALLNNVSVSTARLVRAKYGAAAPGDTLGIANMGPAQPSPAGAMSSGHSPANFDRNTQHPASARARARKPGCSLRWWGFYNAFVVFYCILWAWCWCTVCVCKFANNIAHYTQYADTSDTAFFPIDCLLGNRTCRPPFLGFYILSVFHRMLEGHNSLTGKHLSWVTIHFALRVACVCMQIQPPAL